MSEVALVKLDEAKRILTEARDLTEILEVRDRAVAMQIYAAAKHANDVANVAKEVQLRAERKAGEFLHELDRAQGQRTDLTSVQSEPKLPFGQLVKEVGVSLSQSKRWQTEAKLPEEKFEQYIAETTAKEKELTSAAVYKLAQKHQGKPHVSHNSGNNEWYTPLEYIEAAGILL